MTQWILSSSVLIVGMLLLRRLLRGRISLRLQYALWLVVLLRLLCPVNFFQSSLSIHNVVEPVLMQSTGENLSQNTPGDMTPEADLPQDPVPEDGNGAEALNPPQQGSNAQVPQSTVTDPAPAAPIDWEAVLMVVWALGAVATGAFVLGSNVIFTWLLRRTRQDLDVQDCIVPVYTSHAVRTPCLVGLFRPVIYVTQEVASEPDTWNHVLTHELTHLRHGDHVMGVLRCAALILHWYNPLVWLAVKLIRADGELACDEGTVACLGEQERLDYGRTLIRLTCKSRGPTELVITATTMSDSPDSIRNRIKLIAARPKTLAAALVVCVAAVGILVGCTFTSAVELDEPEQTEPVETTAPIEATNPPQPTEPEIQIPEDYVCLSDLVVYSDIRLYCDDTTIILSEDGMNVELSTDSKLGYRNSYVCVAMKAVPMIVDGAVYVHKGFYEAFLNGDDGIPLSLFNGVMFFPDEVRDALMGEPGDSMFNAKVREQVHLRSSMGIEIPRIDVDRIFQKTALNALPSELYNELRGYGYTGTFTYGEYTIIVNAQTLKAAGISDDDETTVGEYREQQQGQNQLTPEQLAFFEEKQIQVYDYWYLYKWFNGGFMEQSDEALKEALETCYKTDLLFMLDWEYSE